MHTPIRFLNKLNIFIINEDNSIIAEGLKENLEELRFRNIKVTTSDLQYPQLFVYNNYPYLRIVIVVLIQLKTYL
jgi:hypothetical protein